MRHESGAIGRSVVAALALALIGVFVVPMQRAGAASLSAPAACGTGWSIGWTGYELPQGTQPGLRAGIGHDRPYLCSSPPGGNVPTSSAWTMVFNANRELAQAGWLRDSQWASGDNTYFFFECIGCTHNGSALPTAPQQFGLMQSPLQRSYYDQATTYTSGGNVYLNVDPTGDPGGTSYSEELQISWAVDGIEAEAEVHNQETQTTGTTDNPNYFQNLQFLRSGSWMDANIESGYWFTSHANYGKAIPVSGDYFGVEDTRY